MGKHRALPTPGWIEGRSVDIGAGEARSAQPYSQPFKFLKEKLTCNPLFSEGLQVGLRPLSCPAPISRKAPYSRWGSTQQFS